MGFVGWGGQPSQKHVGTALTLPRQRSPSLTPSSRPLFPPAHTSSHLQEYIKIVLVSSHLCDALGIPQLFIVPDCSSCYLTKPSSRVGKPGSLNVP